MLSEEERKAIERLQKRIKDNEDYKTTQVWLTDDVVAANTVLNYITKLQKENKEKDKQIDLMAEWIEKHTKYYDEDGCYCEVEKEICEKDIECKNCIKQYYERKSEEC